MSEIKHVNKVLRDIQIKNGDSLNDKMAHIEIKDNDLVITIDYDHAQFAVLHYLQLHGYPTDQAFKHLKAAMKELGLT